jgi:glutamate 5-kinase
MGVAVLGAMTGDKLVVSANGKDEVKALLSICSFLENDTEDKLENDIFNKYIIGASWMDTDGRLYIVKGFHQEWVEKNLSLLGEGISTANDVIEKLNWINIMVYKDKTIEFHVKDLSETVLERIESFLKDDSFFEWESAHIFTSQKESLYVQIDKNIFNESEKNLKNLLKENKLVTQYY